MQRRNIYMWADRCAGIVIKEDGVTKKAGSNCVTRINVNSIGQQITAFLLCILMRNEEICERNAVYTLNQTSNCSPNNFLNKRISSKHNAKLFIHNEFYRILFVIATNPLLISDNSYQWTPIDRPYQISYSYVHATRVLRKRMETAKY